jgi:ABC-type transporter Mla MlaB component
LDFELNLPPLPVPEPEPVISSDALWESPKELTSHALQDLQQSLLSHAQPWRLGWSRLNHIDSEAMPLLGVLLRKFCEESVQIQFIGAERLIHHLTEMTPTMESAVAPAWWLVRLNALRVVQLYDDFENVAMDYCVTYEVSPPAWEPAKCQYENVIGTHAPTVSPQALQPPELPAVVAAPKLKRVMPSVPAGAVELKGEILGDALDALEAHLRTEEGGEPTYHSGNTLQVYCMHLVRVDFSAAGSILNWAAMRQAEGCKVQFREVNRMVAAFFNVIGIHEHARVIPPAL